MLRIVGESGSDLMHRAGLLLLLALSYGSAVGCSACGTPYDYCSATFTGRGQAGASDCGECGDCGAGGSGCVDGDCRENVRLGSILSDPSIRRLSYDEPIRGDAYDRNRRPTPAEEMPEPAADEQPTLPELSSEEFGESLPADDVSAMDEDLSNEPVDLEPIPAPRSGMRSSRTYRR